MRPMSSAFVTGAGGFIGRHLVRQLLEQDIAVVALMLPNEPTPEEWQDRVRVVVGDVRELTQHADEIDSVDAIFHLAAIVSDWGAHQHHVDVTVKGTEQAIELALRWNARFVVTTSICAYGSALGKGLITEDTPQGSTVSAYEYCKQEQERVTREAVEHKQLNAVIIRPANVYGVGSGPWVNTMVQNLRNGQPCLVGSGAWDAGLVHVNNLCALMIAAAKSDCGSGEVFNAADGFGITWEKYVQDLASIANAPEPKRIPLWLARCVAPAMEWIAKIRKQEERPLLTRAALRLIGRDSRFSISKAESLLGYKPIISYQQAMQELEKAMGEQNVR